MTLAENVVFTILMMLNYWVGLWLGKLLYRRDEKTFVDKFIEFTDSNGNKYIINCSKISAIIKSKPEGCIINIYDGYVHSIKVKNSYEEVCRLFNLKTSKED